VEAAVFPEDPVDFAVFLQFFLKTNEGPGIVLKVGRILITPGVFRLAGGLGVPVFACDLTSPTSGALREVNEFDHLFSFH
jgi:hypothetical protein